MTTAIRRRRGTTVQHSTFTGLEGEVTVDTTKKALVVHDGSTAGGIPVARDSTVVHTTGAETVAGVKTLSSNPVLDGGTANGVAYLNGSKVLTTGSALVFDGTNLGLGVTPSAWDSTYKAIQVGARSMFFGIGSEANMANNAYYNSGYKYVATSAAGLYTIDANVHKWQQAASGTAGNAITFTQAMTLDASGRLLVGYTSATGSPYIQSRTTNSTTISGSYAWNSTDQGISLINESSTTGTGVGITMLGGSSRNSIGAIYMVQETGNSAGALAFYTGGDSKGSPYAFERARITSGGDFLAGQTTRSTATVGFSVITTGGDQGQTSITTSATEVLNINRNTSDGELIRFRQDNTVEGTISVSGTTVSYNGGHLSRWAQTTAPKDDTLVKGTVLSNLDAMNVYTDADGNPVENEQLNKVKVSDTEGDVNVAGVFVNWTYDEAHNVDEINMAMTGDMIIRIAQGTTVQRGDLLMSAGDGTAKPQGDDIVRSKTVAKVTSNHVTCIYEDGSYCVPCVLMAC